MGARRSPIFWTCHGTRGAPVLITSCPAAAAETAFVGRASFGIYNTKSEVDRLAEALIKAQDFFA